VACAVLFDRVAVLHVILKSSIPPEYSVMLCGVLSRVELRVRVRVNPGARLNDSFWLDSSLANACPTSYLSVR
jgi:hypothetical protein